MNCWHCGTERLGVETMTLTITKIWRWHDIVTNLSCPRCESYVEVYWQDRKIMDFSKKQLKRLVTSTHKSQVTDETERFIDTGSYIFNAVVSGSIYGGVSSNKITAIIGKPLPGKYLFFPCYCQNFLDTNPDGYCLYFDTEAAITKGLLASRGIDQNRLVVVNVVTIEEFEVRHFVQLIYTLRQMKNNANLVCLF